MHARAVCSVAGEVLVALDRIVSNNGKPFFNESSLGGRFCLLLKQKASPLLMPCSEFSLMWFLGVVEKFPKLSVSLVLSMDL